MTLTLPELPYAYDALGPYMSAETLEFHHDKHHNAYVTKGNELLAGTGQESASLEDAMCWAHKNNPGLFNQLGQHYNHIHFWNWMAPNGGGSSMPGNLETAIKDSFGDFDTFRGEFLTAGATQFGSGWCWLSLDPQTGKLEVTKTANGENPVVYGKTPLLGCDVWEHSYYIDYRNARPKYLEAFVDSLVNWEYVAELFENGPLKIAA
jgi:Fe-Mn family superoxide dismutase